MSTPSNFDTFASTINHVLDFIGADQKNDKTKAKLITSAYLNFTRLLAESPGNQEILSSLKEKDLSEYSDFEKSVNQITKHLEKQETDSLLGEAMKETLEDFISNLELKLTPEKTEELKKIVSKNF